MAMCILWVTIMARDHAIVNVRVIGVFTITVMVSGIVMVRVMVMLIVGIMDEHTVNAMCIITTTVMSMVKVMTSRIIIDIVQVQCSMFMLMRMRMVSGMVMNIVSVISMSRFMVIVRVMVSAMFRVLFTVTVIVTIIVPVMGRYCVMFMVICAFWLWLWLWLLLLLRLLLILC